jgi:hypothetical protein
MTLSEDCQNLCDTTNKYVTQYQAWWRYNSWWKNAFFSANLACSLGATIFGLLKMPVGAGICGAVLTTVLAVQKQVHFDSEVSWYGNAMIRCNVLLNRIKSATITPEKLQAIEDELNQIVAEEAHKPGGARPARQNERSA